MLDTAVRRQSLVVVRQSTSSRRAVGQPPGRQVIAGQLLDSRWTVAGQLLDSHRTIAGQSTDSLGTVAGQSPDSRRTVAGQSFQ